MIYFIACPEANAVKIGMCRSLRHLYLRLPTMQTDCPFDLEVVAAQDGGLAEEKALHVRFAAARMRGEWFRRTAELNAHIATLTIPEKPFATRQRLAA